jgi:predicted AlkP superfamily phosphohydrolase/phosphomutase
VGEWSGWIPVEFEMMPLFQKVTGMVRFFLKEVHPHFRLYVSPININPADPALPVSTPADYAADVCEEVGFFHTQGIPEDTKALQAGVLDDREYLQQAEAVLQEELKIFDYALAHFDAGLLFYYFSSVDQNYHMFWRAVDGKHVLYSDTLHQRFGDLFPRLYEKMDEVVGRALAKTEDGNTTLLVMSDHGFAPFYRAFHLNTWLKNEGYLVLEDEARQGNEELLQNIDWRRTKAYAMGLNGLYLNMRGREPLGIVRQGKEAEALLEELTGKLLACEDPQSGQPIFARIYRASEIYHGPYVDLAPDLLTGFHRGYRVSWETALGGVPKELLVDNKDKWSGDHCMAAELVPGVVLSNKPILKATPALYDLAPTILQEFGIEKSEQMIGSSIFTAVTAGLSN